MNTERGLEIMQIWKFQLNVGSALVTFRKGDSVLSVAEQHNQPVMYVLTDPSAEETEQRTINTVMTGQDFDGKGTFIGTVSLELGNFILHVFEVR